MRGANVCNADYSCSHIFCKFVYIFRPSFFPSILSYFFPFEISQHMVFPTVLHTFTNIYCKLKILLQEEARYLVDIFVLRYYIPASENVCYQHILSSGN